MRMHFWMGGSALVIAAAFLLHAGDSSSTPAMPANDTSTALHDVIIRRPAGPPRVQSGSVDHAGKPATVACSTCHATRPPNPANRTSADLDLFHQGLLVTHGNAPILPQGTASTNACISCHNSNDYDSLRLADGTRVEFSDVIRLCSQCHGSQYRDYLHGAHGGMNGYWDLTRGGRLRQGCTGCHDPHVPKYQRMLPMPPPHDRFFNSAQTTGANHE